MSRYVSNWWRIDMAYRRCTWHLRRYGQVQVMEQIAQWVEKTYVNNFLLPLADRWSDQVRRLETWECPGHAAQRSFFETYVEPFRAKGPEGVCHHFRCAPLRGGSGVRAAASLRQPLDCGSGSAVWLTAFLHPARNGVAFAGKLGPWMPQQAA